MTPNDDTNGSGDGGRGGDGFDDDERTAPGIRRVASPEALTLANVAIALNKLGNECAPLAAAWDRLPPDEQRIAARAFSRKYRELGDIGHDIARILEEIASG